MEYKYINISKCGNWVQSKEDDWCIIDITNAEDIKEMFRYSVKKELIPEILHYIMNREVTK